MHRMIWKSYCPCQEVLRNTYPEFSLLAIITTDSYLILLETVYILFVVQSFSEQSVCRIIKQRHMEHPLLLAECTSRHVVHPLLLAECTSRHVVHPLLLAECTSRHVVHPLLLAECTSRHVVHPLLLAECTSRHVVHPLLLAECTSRHVVHPLLLAECTSSIVYKIGRTPSSKPFELVSKTSN